MAITKSRDKRTGITYVYSSESYWDKEKKAPRNRKKLIGKIDEATGEIVPTGKRGRKPKEAAAGTAEDADRNYKGLYEAAKEQLQQKEELILELNAQLEDVKKELKQKTRTLEKIRMFLG